MLDIKTKVAAFLNDVCKSSLSFLVYNEFSLQHELGIYLRENCKGYTINFERNVSFFNVKGQTCKKEIDISIYNDKEKYAIELKFPVNGQYPAQMGQFVKDIQFMEELVKDGGFTKTLCLTLVDDKGFYKPNRNNAGIYSYFRLGTPIKGNIEHQINQTHYQYYITGNYNIKWCSLTEKVKYYIVEIPSKG